MGRKPGSSQWKQRRVAFILSDTHHKISPVSIFMPVRVKERGERKTVFEGPIEAVWEIVQQRLSLNQHGDDPTVWTDLVGVLYANDEQMDFGRIDWLVQSETIPSMEEGADLISVPEHHAGLARDKAHAE